MPSANVLPDNLQKIARIQALELSDERWEFDMDQLIYPLVRPDGGTHAAVPPTPTHYSGPRPRSYASAAMTVSLPAAFFFGLFMIMVLTLSMPEPIGTAFADVLPWGFMFGLFFGLIFGFFLRGK